VSETCSILADASLKKAPGIDAPEKLRGPARGVERRPEPPRTSPSILQVAEGVASERLG
jgi:hypothetical protein